MQDGRGDVLDRVLRLGHWVVQVVPHHLPVCEGGVCEVSRIQSLLEGQEPALEDQVGGPAEAGLQLGPLLLEHGQRRGLRQQPVGLQAIGHLEAGKLLHRSDTKLLCQPHFQLLQGARPGHVHLPNAVIDEQHGDGQKIGTFVHAIGRSIDVQVGHTLLGHMLDLAVAALDSMHDEGPHKLVELLAGLNLLAQAQHQLPAQGHGAIRGVLPELLHHLHIDLVGQGRTGLGHLGDVLPEAEALGLRQRAVPHPAQDAVEATHRLPHLAAGHLGQGIPDLQFGVSQHRQLTVLRSCQQTGLLVALPLLGRL
mmetsp:Transcript_49787/g.118642  ORF Transcript_49787/g.118642 Transcript_49787/m.118642 type:complete len:309 (+) Transcript_49787:772-1698(+)